MRAPSAGAPPRTVSSIRSSTVRSPARNRSMAARVPGGLDVGEVAHLADVHADDRHAGAGDQVDGAQHRAVAAEAHREVEARRRGSPRRTRASARPGDVGVGLRDPHLVALVLQPRGRLPRQVGRLRCARGGARSRWRPSARRSPRRRAASTRGVDVDRAGRRRCGRAARNSTLPSAPVSGDAMAPMMAAPARSSARSDLARAPAATPSGSVMTPLPAGRLLPAGLELRLHEEHQIGARRGQRRARRAAPCGAR